MDDPPKARRWSTRAGGFERPAAAVHYRIATGPHTRRKALTLRTVFSNPPADNPCIAQRSGALTNADMG